MKREYIDSGDITSAGYDEGTSIMEIEFTNGTIFQYVEVSRDVYDGLMAAADAGKYFALYIKNKYKFFEVDKE